MVEAPDEREGLYINKNKRLGGIYIFVCFAIGTNIFATSHKTKREQETS